MPGIDWRAPERQETKSGLSGSPYFMPMASSVFFKAAATSSFSPLGNLPPALK